MTYNKNALWPFRRFLSSWLVPLLLFGLTLFSLFVIFDPWMIENFGVNRAQLAAALFAVMGVMATIWAAKERADEQRISEDRRAAQQNAINQRLQLTERFFATVEKLSSSDSSSSDSSSSTHTITQCFALIDDLYLLTKFEAKISDSKSDKEEMEAIGRTRRQEALNIACQGTGSEEVMGRLITHLRDRLNPESPQRTLDGLNFSGITLGDEKHAEKGLASRAYFGDKGNQTDLSLLLFAENTKFDRAEFFHCNFSSTSFVRSIFRNSLFDHCSLQEMNLSFSDFRGCNFVGNNFHQATFADCYFQESDFAKSFFFGVNFQNSIFESCAFTEAVFSFCKLDNCDFRDTNLRKANFKGADLRTAKLPVGYHAQLRDPLDQRSLLDGAIYNSNTQFPKGFSPSKHGMIKVG